MTDRITKLQRWIDLIAYLSARRYPVAIEQIMEALPAYARKWAGGGETERASARRMFERDKDELRGAGVPIETVAYSINQGTERTEGYRLQDSDFYLPYLKLVTESRADATPDVGERECEIAPEEATTALDALREAADWPAFPLARGARSAFRKLAFDLDADRMPGESSVLYVDRPGAAEISARVRALADALLARKRVRFRYHGIKRDDLTTRDVAPYGLLFQQGHWYLIGHDELRDDVRVFRAGRMEELLRNERAPATPDYEIPDDFRLEDYRDRQAWELGDDEDEQPLIAQVAFRFPASLWAERNGYGRSVEERPDGSAVREFEVRQSGPFLRWVLGLAGDAEIMSPPGLAAELRALARDVVTLYGGGVGGAGGGASA